MSQLEIGGLPPVAPVTERNDHDTGQQRHRGRKHPGGGEDAELDGTSSDAETEDHMVDDTA
jgi:hypothetical protein